MRTLCGVTLLIMAIAGAGLAQTTPVGTYTVPYLINGSDTVRFWWDPSNAPFGWVYSINGEEDGLVPHAISGNPITTILVNGLGNNVNVVIDETMGVLATSFSPSVEFDNGTGTDVLTALGNGAGNTLTFAPDENFQTPTNSFTIDGTLVTYNPNVQPPQFQLGSGINTITVQGDSHYAESVKWNNSSFDPNENSNLSLTVESNGEIIFDRDAESGAAIGTLAVADGGELAMLNVGLGEEPLVFSGSADLGGELSVTLEAGYLPAMGDSLVLIQSPNLSGTFAAYDLPALGNGLSFEAVYTQSSFSLQVIPEPTGEIVLAGLVVILAMRGNRTGKGTSDKSRYRFDSEFAADYHIHCNS
jgi:hypothetical protein